MMRRILVDRARARKMAKRSGQWARHGRRCGESDAAPECRRPGPRRGAREVRRVRPAKLSAGGTPVFGGLSLADAGDALGISRRPSAIGRRRGRGCPRNYGRGTAVTPERWRHLTGIFHAALARDAGDRPAFLADACAGDEGMRSEIESMLAQPESSDGFLGGLAFAATSTPDGMGTPDLTNRSFGPYHIEARIGAGGMGEVPRAGHETRARRGNQVPAACLYE